MSKLLTDISDEGLYDSVQAGDTQAFRSLYDRHSPALLAFIRRYLRSIEEAEEVLQETFIKVLRYEPLDFTKGSFKGWLYLVARNHCLNQLRSTKREVALSESISIPCETHHSELSIIGRALPPDLQQLLSLRMSGLNQIEIAAELRVPVGTVKSRTHRLMQLVRKESQND